jgi:ABC-type lipoprotein release transport system permease subunit
MKPFKINRNSWHYRMNQRFLNEYSYDMRNWEYRRNNFCSYWRATAIRLVALVVCAVIVMSFAIATVMAFIIAPAKVGLTVLVIVAVFSVLGFITYLSNRPTSNEPPTSLLAQRYRAYKDKVCPMIEYDK